MQATLDEFDEAPPMANGEVVLAIARGVGILAGIVAVLMWFMIMMMGRAIIAFTQNKWGVSGVALVLAIFVGLVMRYGKVSSKLIWTILTRSCQ
jgi:hypothetical protein